MTYRVIKTKLPEVLILEPNVFGDDRGLFFESFNKKAFFRATGLDVEFVQDNHSVSSRGVLRGLHYQIEHPQGKLVRVSSGAVFDVAVDIRSSSANLGKWVGVELSAENKRQLWVPPGFAHGFIVTSESADFLYKTTDYWHKEHERTLLWCDPSIDIHWPIVGNPIVASKDAAGTAFLSADLFL